MKVVFVDGLHPQQEAHHHPDVLHPQQEARHQPHLREQGEELTKDSATSPHCGEEVPSPLTQGTNITSQAYRLLRRFEKGPDLGEAQKELCPI